MTDAEQLLARAEELADTRELAEQVMIILGRARSSRVDQDALGGLVRAIKLLGGDGGRAVRTAARGHGQRFANDRAMFTAIDDAADACAERDQAVRQLAKQVREALRRAHDDLDEAHEELEAARAMPVDDPCDGCHEDRAEAIAGAEEHIREAEHRIEVLEEARDKLDEVHAGEAAYQLETVADDYVDLYASVLDLVRADPQAMPESGDFITGFSPRGLELPARPAGNGQAADPAVTPDPTLPGGEAASTAGPAVRLADGPGSTPDETGGHEPQWVPQAGDAVLARRYVQPTLKAGDPARELQFDCTGVADGQGGMRTASGDYLNFGYVFLPEGWHDGSNAYLVTEVRPQAAEPGQSQDPADGRVVRLADGSGRKVQRTWPDGAYDCPWCHSPVPAGVRLSGLPCPNPGCVVNMTTEQLRLWRAHLAQRAADERDREAIGRFNAEMARKRGEEEERLWAEVEAQRVARGGCLLCLQRSRWCSGQPHIVRHRNPDHHGDGQRWQPDEVPGRQEAPAAASPGKEEDPAPAELVAASTSYDVDAIVADIGNRTDAEGKPILARYRESAAISSVTGIDSGAGGKYGPMVNLCNDLRHGLIDPVDLARWQVAEGFSRESVAGQADRAEAIAQVLDRTEHSDDDVRQWMPEHPAETARMAAGLHEYARAAREALGEPEQAAAAASSAETEPAPEPPAVTSPALEPEPAAAGPDWQAEMARQREEIRAAGEANARALNRRMALTRAQDVHLREAYGLTLPHPADMRLGGAQGTYMRAGDQIRGGDLHGGAQTLAHTEQEARAARDSKAAARLMKLRGQVQRAAAGPARTTLPALTRMPGGTTAGFTALDHRGREYQIGLRKGTVTVTTEAGSLSAPAGDGPTAVARALAGQLSEQAQTPTTSQTSTPAAAAVS